MNKAWMGAAGLAVMAGGTVAFTAWSGGRVDDALQQRTANGLAGLPGVKVLDNRVERGFLASTHHVAVEIGCAPQAPVARVGWRSRVQHGPVPGARALGLATIDTDFTLPAGVPLSAHTTVGFGGAVTTAFASPSFKHVGSQGASIEWKDLRATWAWNARQGMAAGAHYTVNVAETVLDLPLPANQATVADVPLPTGRMSTHFGPLAASGRLGAQGASPWWARPSSGALHIDSARLTAGTVKGGTGPLVTVDLKHIDASAATATDTGLWGAALLGSTQARVNGFDIDRVEMNTSLKRLHIGSHDKAISALSALAELGCGGGAVPTNAGAEIAQALLGQLTHHPEFSIDRLAVTLGEGQAELSLNLGVLGVSDEDIADVDTLGEVMKSKLHGQVSASANVAWIEQLAQRFPAGWLPAELASKGMSEPTRLSLQRAVAYSGIDAGVKERYIVRDGQQLSARAALRDGKFTVNGERAPAFPPLFDDRSD